MNRININLESISKKNFEEIIFKLGSQLMKKLSLKKLF